jgi:rare lipoprotein A
MPKTMTARKKRRCASDMTGPGSLAVILMACCVCCAAEGSTAEAGAAAKDLTQGAAHAKPAIRAVKPKLDRSGRKRSGRASIYAKQFSGKKMADGTIMHPQSDSAASKTLPLETRAKVTDIETGRSAEVVIRDRGPYVPGRIIDLSPATAQKIGLEKAQGVALVTVTPIANPPPVGDGKPGESGR